MPSLVVGCPVWRREWILRPWFQYVEEACRQLGAEPSYIFTIDHRDALSLAVIEDHCMATGRKLSLVMTDEDQDQFREDRRDWSHPRVHHMVWLRNKLLGAVRKQSPDLFLSLDSDILLAVDALPQMIEDLAKFDAVGTKCFMTQRGTREPSYAMLVNANSLIRNDAMGVMPVDVIMAAKLLTPAAYNIDYRFHVHGEDVGWSLACTKVGLHLGWDGRSCSKHVMGPEHLSVVDARCGY